MKLSRIKTLLLRKLFFSTTKRSDDKQILLNKGFSRIDLESLITLFLSASHFIQQITDKFAGNRDTAYSGVN